MIFVQGHNNCSPEETDMFCWAGCIIKLLNNSPLHSVTFTHGCEGGDLSGGICSAQPDHLFNCQICTANNLQGIGNDRSLVS